MKKFVFSRLRVLAIAFIFLLMLSGFAVVSLRPSHSAKATGSWYINGTEIIDPNGNPFVAKGVNVIGPNWVWPGHATQDADSIINSWKFNLVRVDMNSTPVSGSFSSDHYDTLDQIIQTFTGRGIPVVIAPSDNPAANWSNTSKVAAFRTWLQQTAATYKNNSYVWYDVVGENGDSCNAADPSWVTINQTLLSDVRDVGGANNIFITEGNNWGQEGNCGAAGNIPTSDSAFLSFGSQLFHFNNKNYSNILFSIHVYDEWSTGDSSRMGDYLDRINANGWAIYIGEFGDENNGSLNRQAITNMYGATVPRGIGRGAVWHWYNASGPPDWGNALTTAGNGTTGASINSTTNPTNLTWLGQQVWNDTHSNTPTPTPIGSTPTPSPTPSGNKYEAESAALSGGADVNTNHSGYSGTGFVEGYWNVGATTTFTVNVTSAGTYNVDLRYGNNMGNTRTLDIYVNGTLSKTTNLANLANWDTWSDQTESLSLKSSSNTIAYKYDSSNSGNVNLDYITISGPTGGGGGGVLSRSGWTASASASDTAEWPSRAIDGNLTTRWTTGHSMTNGDWFEIDMGSAQSFSKLVLDATNDHNDYPRGYSVYVSNDGSNWGSAVATGSGSSAVTTITFSTQNARYVRVVQTGSSSSWWSIDEFNAYS